MRTAVVRGLFAAIGCFGAIVDAKEPADAPPARVLAGHEDWIAGLAFTPDGNRLVTGSVDKTVRVWDVKSKETVQEIEIALPVYGLALLPDGKTVAVVTPHPDKMGDFPEKFQYALWDLKSGERIKAFDVGEIEGRQNFSPNGFSPDGKSFVTTGEKGVRLWDMESGTSREVFHDEYGCNVPIFSPDGTRLACATGKQGPLLVKLSGAEVPKLERSKIFSYQFAFSRDGKLLAACGHNDQNRGCIALWDTETGTLRYQRECEPLPEPHKGSLIEDLDFSPDGRLLASGYPLFAVRLWSVADGQALKTWKNYTRHGDTTGGVSRLVFSPNGKTLAVANGEYVNLWSVRTLLKP